MGKELKIIFFIFAIVTISLIVSLIYSMTYSIEEVEVLKQWAYEECDEYGEKIIMQDKIMIYRCHDNVDWSDSRHLLVERKHYYEDLDDYYKALGKIIYQE